MEFTINYLAVFVSAVVVFLIGWAWHGPMFGKKWVGYVGFTPEALETAKKEALPSMIGGFLMFLVMSYCMAHMVQIGAKADPTWDSPAGGAMMGFYIWTGFVVTVLAGSVFWERRPWGLFFINAGYQLIALLVMGVILAYWK